MTSPPVRMRPYHFQHGGKGQLKNTSGMKMREKVTKNGLKDQANVCLMNLKFSLFNLL